MHAHLGVLNLVYTLETLLELVGGDAQLASLLHQLQLLDLLIQKLGARVARWGGRMRACLPLRIQIE
jgi:hypothetical protein